MRYPEVYQNILGSNSSGIYPFAHLIDVTLALTPQLPFCTYKSKVIEFKENFAILSDWFMLKQNMYKN